LVLLVCTTAGSCSTHDRAAVAAAKCALPVAQEAGFPADSSPQQEAVEVKTLGQGGFRVTGRSARAGQAVSVVCEVAPDSSDKLRGFKVTHLEVTPA
jgi:hypothetical protein